MSRNEYLQNTNEGFIKDTIKKGWEKLKSLFKIGMMKIRDFITIFDSDGNVFPVVSLQATIDRVSDVNGVEVFTPSSINDTVIAAGGQGCEEKASLIDDDSTYDDDSWSGDDYKNSNEYQNFLSIPSIIKEHYNCTDEEAHEIFEYMMIGESWDGITKNRVKYVDRNELSGLAEINYDQFEEIINEMVEERSKEGGKTRITSTGRSIEPSRNLLIFGAPGIGKSTIPNTVIRKYNESVGDDPSKQITLISINCALLEEGGFMMPTMPKESDIMKSLERFSKTFPQANEFLSGLDDEENEKIAQTISASAQFRSTDAPKSWLPSYKPTGDRNIDILLDSYANGGVYEDADGFTCKTGSGGIILFDEFLRANPGVFSQLMNFFLERKLYDWKLGSKWTVIACSNRPCDDGQVERVWKDWNDSPASKDRMERMFQLVPDPDQWKEWIRTKHVDELLLDFIFEKDSMVGDEYPRWHSMVRKGSGDSKQVEPINPRRWESAFKRLIKFEEKHGYDDISQMTDEEIANCLSGLFDTDFVAEITSWLRDHMDKIDLDGIMEDPKSVYLPKKFINDPAKALILIQNLLKDFEGRYKDNPGDCSDKQLANIITWLGINYKEDMVAVQNFMEEIIKNIFKNNSEYKINNYIKTMQTLFAAYPERDIEEVVQKEIKRDGWEENSMEIIKGLMNEYFPWRIDGDKIKFFDDLDISTEDYEAKTNTIGEGDEK